MRNTRYDLVMASLSQSEAELFQALASPVRVRMLELLRASGSMTVSEMQQRLGIEAANASQHLRVLRDRGLVQRRRDGTSIWYSIVDPALHTLLDDARAIAERHDAAPRTIEASNARDSHRT